MTQPKIYGLSGYAQTGKDSVGAVFVKEHRFRRRSFADKLRALALTVDPVVDDRPPRHRNHLTLLSDVVGYHGWEIAKDVNPQVRGVLQRLGVGARRVLGEDVWVNAGFRGMHADGKYVFTDVRFPNEAQAIVDYGGVIVRIDRPGFGPVNQHESETAMDTWHWDYVLSNDGTLEELPVRVAALLHAYRRDT